MCAHSGITKQNGNSILNFLINCGKVFQSIGTVVYHRPKLLLVRAGFYTGNMRIKNNCFVLDGPAVLFPAMLSEQIG